VQVFPELKLQNSKHIKNNSNGSGTSDSFANKNNSKGAIIIAHNWLTGGILHKKSKYCCRETSS